MGSLKNDLLLPPNFKPSNPDDDELDDDLMLLGTTPNVGSAGVTSSALRAGAAARATHAAFGRESNFHTTEVLSRCIDEEDELMGMSPDMPSMMRSPAAVAVFSDFMKQRGQGSNQSSLAAAAAAPNEQVPTMVGAFSAQDV